MSRIKVDKHDNLYIDTRTQIYWWIEQIDNVHYRKSTGEKTIGKALTKIKWFRSNLKGINTKT